MGQSCRLNIFFFGLENISIILFFFILNILKYGLLSDSETATRRLGFFFIKIDIILSKSLLVLKGDVQGTDKKMSGKSFFFFRNFSACFQDKYSGLKSVERFFGRMNGTIAPAFFASFAILDESVDIKLLLINLLFLQSLIAQEISDLFLNFYKFLFCTPFEPPLAKVKE